MGVGLREVASPIVAPVELQAATFVWFDSVADSTGRGEPPCRRNRKLRGTKRKRATTRQRPATRATAACANNCYRGGGSFTGNTNGQSATSDARSAADGGLGLRPDPQQQLPAIDIEIEKNKVRDAAWNFIRTAKNSTIWSTRAGFNGFGISSVMQREAVNAAPSIAEQSELRQGLRSCFLPRSL